ncbi:MAG: cyclic nucleotide-binding domain-containing protein [Bdellovibrio sp.]|nr:cyclic nucleotide-binding domain-containing protein [Bdellovibrio sp.]
MKIESKPIEFHESCQFEKLILTPLQIQYLIFLRMNKSIYELVQYNLSKGLLVNFTELYAMIEMFATHHWIINPEIKDYFDNINPKKISTPAPLQNESTGPAKIKFDDLLKLPFFRSLDPQLAQFLFKSSKLFKLKANTYVCQTGDNNRSLFVLLNGQVGVYKNDWTQKQLIALLNNHSVFGEAGFLLGEKRSADVITLKNSDVLVIPYNEEKLGPFLNKTKASEVQHRFWVQHALLHSELFKSIPADCLDALTSAGKIVELKKDHILFAQGDASDGTYIVIQGEVKIEKDGKHIRSLSQGASIGEISMMASRGLRTATVTSLKDTLLLFIHRDAFYDLLSTNLVLAKEIERLMRQRLKDDAQRPK